MKTKILDKGLNFKENNLSMIKFFLAYLVVFSHSFPITNGPTYFDPIHRLTNGQLDLGNLSVCIFLFYSGLLITSSLLRTSQDGRHFFRKRLKRIIPPLFIVLIFTAFIIGPIFTDISLKDYFSDISPYMYVLKNTFLITTHNIIGLWENNPYNLSANGSLWTLPVEFLCYIACFILYKMKLLNSKKFKYTLIPFLILFISQKFVYDYFPFLEIVLPLFMLFYIGILYYIYQDKIILNNYIAILMFILIIISLKFNLYIYMKIIAIPYIFTWLAFYFKVRIKSNIFKLSYEIYLIGFVIQQAAYCLCNTNNPFLNFLIVILPILLIAKILYIITNKKEVRGRKNEKKKNNSHICSSCI